LNPEESKDNFLGEKQAVYQKHIEDLGVSSAITIVCGFWYEYSLSGYEWRFGFDFPSWSLTLYDKGNTKICVSTWPQIGKAVANLLSLPITADGKAKATLTQFKNKGCYINSYTLSQRDMFDSVMRVTGTTEKDWKVKQVDVKERYAEGVKKLQSGDRSGFGQLL